MSEGPEDQNSEESEQGKSLMKYEILAQGAVSTLHMVCKCTAIMITVTDTSTQKHTQISIDTQGE